MEDGGSTSSYARDEVGLQIINSEISPIPPYLFSHCGSPPTSAIMKLLSLFSILLAFTKASPIQQEKRQLNGLLSSLAGTLGVDQTFDYIVLGGGTAGLTIAKRLAENTAVSVAVIEAGTLYQVADPVLATTPVGDVAFVGMVKRGFG